MSNYRDKEKQKATRHAYYVSHPGAPERIREHSLKYYTKWATKPDAPEKHRRKRLNKIGWTPELFDERIKEQEGTCAICKKDLTFEKKVSGSRACADHEHSNPPKPRGVLCANCNLGIGHLQDSVSIMRAAIAYIEKYGG